MATPLQAAFTGGELTPALHVRVDLAKYLTSLKTCRNFFVRRTGGVSTRPGFQFISKAGQHSATSRLIRFVFSRTQSYLLEFGDGYVAFIANGGRVLDGTTAAISAVTTASVFTVTTTAPHGWSSGQLVGISGAVGTGAIGELNGDHRITVTGVSTFTVPRVTMSTAAWVSGGTVTGYLTVSTPYTQADLPHLRVTQSADVATIVLRGTPQYELRRESGTSFTLAAVEYKDGPFQDVNTDDSVKIYASAETGTVSLVSTGDVFEAGHVGGLIRLDSENYEDDQWQPADGYTAGQRVRHGVNVYVATQWSGNSGSVPPTHTEGREWDGNAGHSWQWEYLHSGYGVARILTVSDSKHATAKILSRLPLEVVGGATTAYGPWTMTGDGVDVTLAAATATSDSSADYEVTFDGVIQDEIEYSVDATANVITFATAPGTGVAVSARQLTLNRRTSTWYLGAWSDVQGYPGAASFYNSRLIFAGTTDEPQRVDASRIGDYVKFSENVPLEDSDAINLPLGGREMSAITDLVPLTRLVALTAGGAYRIGGDSDVLTPSNAGTKPLNNIGSADIPATLVGTGAVYVQRDLRKIRSISYNELDGAASSELTIFCDHLFSRGYTVVGMDYAEAPYGIIWAVRNNGDLVSITYLPEQEVIAAAWHQTDGEVEQVCVIPEDEVDSVYVLVKREIAGNTYRYIERLTDRDPDDSRDMVCVDSALSYDGRMTGTVLLSGSSWAANDHVTATRSSGSWTAADIGKQIWLYGESLVKGTITTSGSSVDLLLETAVPASLQNVSVSNWAVAVTTLSGLQHLSGKTVSVQTDGVVHNDLLVVDGEIALSYHTAIAHVGLGFTANIETLPLTIVNKETIRWRKKTVPKVAVLVTESASLWAGRDAAHLDHMEGRDVSDSYAVPEPFTGLMEVAIDGTWEDTGQVQVWQQEAAPLTILGLIPDVKVGS